MGKNLNFFLFLLFSLIKNILLNEEIIFAFQIFKHGASAPISGVKDGLDLFSEEWLNNGEISNIGKRQHYLLGIKAYKRYIKSNFLKEEYDPNEIFIKSTDSNRTIESTYAFFQGLFPNGTRQTIKTRNINKTNIIYPPNSKYNKKFDEILKYYSIYNTDNVLPYNISILPTHIFYIPDVEIQLYDPKICKGLEKEYKKLNEKKDIKEFSKKIMSNNEELFKKIEQKYTGKKLIDSKFMENYDSLSRYTDNFVCDITDKRNFSKLNETFSSHTLDLNNLYNYSKSFIMKDYFVNNNLTNRSIVEAALTLRSIQYWMYIAKTYRYKRNIRYFKYIVYSVDENTIGAIEGYMSQLFNISIEYAEYAESRIFELYYDNLNKNYFVRYLKGDNDIKMNIKYNNFSDIIRNKTWKFWEITKYCQLEEKVKNYDINLVGASLMIILSVIDGVLIVLLILFCAKKTYNK